MADSITKLTGLPSSQKDEDEGGGSGSGVMMPSTLFDPHREVVALQEIRQVEEQQFGPVDASTQSDLLKKESSNEEGLEAVAGALAHPVLEKEAYFSGIDEMKNNPLLSNNTEAELNYKKQELKYQKDLQLQKNLDLVNSKKFNPTPRPI